MNVLRTPLSILGLALLVAGCAGSKQRTLWPAALPTLDPTPYALTLEYVSDLPDPYYVTSGPAQTYARFGVSEQLHALLDRQVALLSDPGSSKHATLAVRAVAVATTYHQLGSAPGPDGRWTDMYAALGGGGAGLFGILDLDGNSDIPEEVHKGATLTLEVALRADDKPELIQTITAEDKEVTEKWDFDRRKTYDYGPVLSRTINRAVEQVAAAVQSHLL